MCKYMYAYICVYVYMVMSLRKILTFAMDRKYNGNPIRS